MEAECKALRRKPLSDCTNTTGATTATSTSAASKKTSSISSKSAVVKSLIPSNVTNNHSNSSLKSNTSTGSNNPPSVPSSPSPSNPPGSSERLLESGENGRRRSKPPPAQNQRQDVQTSKDKGKAVSGNPVTVPSYLSTRCSLQPTSSPGSPQNQIQAAHTWKDKGKAVLDYTILKPFHLPTPHGLQLPSFAASGGSGIKISGAPAVPNQTQASQTWKDKGEVGVENPFIKPLHLLTPHSVLTPLSAAGGSGCKMSRSLAAQSEVQTTQTRKNKGKGVVENRPNEPSLMSTPFSLRLASSAASVGTGSKTPRPPAAQHQKEATQTRKEKGKAVSENPSLEPSHLSATHNLWLHSSTVSAQNQIQAAHTGKDKGKAVLDYTIRKPFHLPSPHGLQLRSFAMSGGSGIKITEAPAVLNQTQVTHTWKDKDKVVVENPFIQPLRLPIPHSVQIPSSSAGGSGCKISRPLEAQSEVRTTQTRKDKGKAVLENYMNEPSDMSAPFSQRLTSSPASVGTGSKTPRPPAAQHQVEATQTRKASGEAVSESPTLESSNLSSTHKLQLHSSTLSGGNQNQTTQTRKDEGMVVLGGTTIETSDLSTTRNLKPASSAASGTSDHVKSKFPTVYTQKRVQETQKRKVGKRTLAFSCPPGKRIKDIGNNIDNGGAGSHSRSCTDPLPVHKKKRSRVNRNEGAHALRQDEIERLRAYYADVDAFELPVEIASDGDLD